MEHAILSFFRINTKSEKSPIILKFISCPARNNFYDMYINTIKNGPFSVKMIGFNSNERIIVQESLSSKNSAIFRKSMEFKKNDLIHSVYTRNGHVRIKTTSDSKAIMVSSIQQLSDIVSSVKKNSRNKRKINNSSQSDSLIVENDHKIIKSGSIKNDQSKIFSSTLISDSVNLNTGSPTTTVIANLQRKKSSGTLNEFLIKN